MLKIIAFSALLMFFICFWNALAFRLYFKKEDLINTLLHRTGAMIRLLIIVGAALALHYISGYSWVTSGRGLLVLVFIAWPVYDLLYNHINDLPWYYSGPKSKSLFDRYLHRFDEFLKLILLFVIIWYNPVIDTIKNRLPSLLISIVLIAAGTYVSYRFYNKKKE